MLRDVSRIYAMLLGFLVLVVLFVGWYSTNYSRSSDVLQLNEVLLSNAVNEVDPTSRFYEGALLLSPTFETSVWERISNHYPEGSIVCFEYLFDQSDTRFTGVPSGDSSPDYVIGERMPDVSDMGHMIDKPIKFARVMVREPDEKLTDWTYTGTITVDAVSR